MTVKHSTKKQDKAYDKKRKLLTHVFSDRSIPQVKAIAIWHDKNGEHELVKFYDPRIGTAKIRRSIFTDLESTSKAAVQSGTISLEFPKKVIKIENNKMGATIKK